MLWRLIWLTKSYLTWAITQDSNYDNSNNLVIGKMKDGTYGKPIKGSVWLKAKNYIFITEDNH